MKSIVLGYPRIGKKRALKKAIEAYWKGQLSEEELSNIAKSLRATHWNIQKEQEIDLIASNDFSLYDQMLDMCITLGCIPQRFANLTGLEQYFAMARGLQSNSIDVTAMEMTKWFDTNYHYIVPELVQNQSFSLNASKILTEIEEAKSLGIKTKPVIIGPVTFLLLSKTKDTEFDPLELLETLLPVYQKLIQEIDALGVEYLQIDEPILATTLSASSQLAIKRAYTYFSEISVNLKYILANYFDSYDKNLELALELPVHVLHLDLVRAPQELEKICLHPAFDDSKILSLGLIDGRNVWKNDFENSLHYIQIAQQKLSDDKLWIGTSCSLLHTPYDLDLEANNSAINNAIEWLAFAKQKLKELTVLKKIATKTRDSNAQKYYSENLASQTNRRHSKHIHNPQVKARVAALKTTDSERHAKFSIRQALQRTALNLPLFPTTTIGSFPQTKTLRQMRAKFKKGTISQESYDAFIKKEIEESIHFQEEIGLDVLVHGEFERNDMVEYFGQQLEGFVFTQYGWVQSYGTRCVKPPIIYGDVSRPAPMTIRWSAFAESIASRPVKGMLTGPVTILQWSFVRDDQPRSVTCNQIAFAIRDEVCDLEKAGLKVIQIDEPAIREGLPLKQETWKQYLNWAIKAFRISASGVANSTQIHTHMCYSEFNDIIEDIAAMDADVITIETSRSEMELLNAFVDFEYPNEIGPGVYDIHAPRVPSQNEIVKLLEKASALLPAQNLWVNPDCGLKTRGWPETKSALKNLVESAKKMRQKNLQNL